jgi:hypothetical protein
MLISENYRQLNQKLHEIDVNWGIIPKWTIRTIAIQAKRLNVKSILDYGAGKEALKHALPQFNVISYDPGIPAISRLPEPADFLVCTATLEHIEPECLDHVLDHMERCTIKAAYLTVSTIPSSKILADGRNPHLIVEKMHWWLPHLMKRWEVREAVSHPGVFWFYGKKHK